MNNKLEFVRAMWQSPAAGEFNRGVIAFENALALLWKLKLNLDTIYMGNDKRDYVIKHLRDKVNFDE